MITPGTKLAHYEIEESIGAGGMGEVYRARDVRLDRVVAIKVLPSHLSENKDLRDRFDREAKTISNLQHPNICALHDVGHEDGVDFLVMEHLEGETLATRLERGPLGATELVPVAMQIAGALEAAHKNGVVHRDLKPGNVILTKTGAKLLDFGLAKIAVADEPTQSSTFTQLATGAAQSAPLTEKGTILGTFQYMSPEQLEGKEADARSDIFSFGAMLYEMATGAKAFSGDSQASLIVSIMTSQPQPITTIQPMTPPALDRLIRTCLEKDPDTRWQTAHDIALQLKWIQEGGSELGIPKPVAAKRRGQARMAWLLAGLFALSTIALAALRFTQPEPPAPRAMRFSIEAPSGVTSFGSPRISPDGTMIAFNGTDTTGTDMIWLRPLNSTHANPLPGTEGAGRPFWSPDSRHVAFFTANKLLRVPVAGGPPLTLSQSVSGADGCWGRDFILFDGGQGDSLRAVPVGGGEIRPASTIDRAGGEHTGAWPFFLPDGERFVFIRMKEGPDEIHLGRIGSMESKMLTTGDSRLEFAHPGYLVYERGGTLLAQKFDLRKEELVGDAFALTEGIGTGAQGLAHFSFSNDGVLIYTQGEPPERQIVQLDRAGRTIRTIGDPDLYTVPALSPDETMLAVERLDPQSGDMDIWIWDLERKVRSRFTFEDRNTDPAWSPDGSDLAFISRAGGGRNIVRKSISGTGTREVIVSRGHGIWPLQWPDENTMFFACFRPGSGYDAGWLAIDAPDSLQFLCAETFHEFQPRRSPNGRLMAYGTTESGSQEVYLRGLGPQGGKWQVSTNGGTEPQWRGDGKELYYLSVDRALMAVSVEEGVAGKEVRLGAPVKLFEAPVQRDNITRNRISPARDGQSFYCLALVDGDRVPPTQILLNWTAELEER